MTDYAIAVLPGDGLSPEVIDAAPDVIDAAADHEHPHLDIRPYAAPRAGRRALSAGHSELAYLTLGV
ncbi:hypothetical protein [Arthrobacter sp. UYCu712]|uniref:hypothetical protein n=1 Tax=Arthrobacter sp. UYCu712 TaxID=3156340 RepID=UPI003392C098